MPALLNLRGISVSEILVDSSVLIDFFEQKLSPKGREWLSSYSTSISVVSYFEICRFFYKTGKSKELATVKMRLDSFDTKSISTEICDEAAKLSSSHNLSVADALIYATAKAHSMRLLTSDSDLKNLPGVVFV